MDISDDKKFWLCNGNSLGSLDELVDALRDMDDGVFRHHVNDEKNDFYNWIRDVIEDQFLADKIKGSMDRAETAEIIESLSKRKCQYLSPVLECLVGGKGTVNCLMNNYHRQCKHKNNL